MTLYVVGQIVGSFDPCADPIRSRRFSVTVVANDDTYQASVNAMKRYTFVSRL
jgi:hypothetical protein